MKKILITGDNSYIGTSFENHLKQFGDEYSVKTITLRDDKWKEHDFSQYDVVFNVAGIAHIKETAENRDLYYKVNHELAVDVAKKAKSDGVPHYVLLSSMSVYGASVGNITKETLPAPKSNYGKSKLMADQEIEKLADNSFTVSLLRPPMVYGNGCKGNYRTLSKFAKKLPFFPNYKNQRSMIFIDNLSEFVRFIIDSKKGGIFFPQNSEYVNTSEMVALIAKENGRNIKLTKAFNWGLKLFPVSLVKKVFGNLTYEKGTDLPQKGYKEVPFEESIIKSERE